MALLSRSLGLSLWSGLAAVGLYALGWNIASAISVAFISPFMQSWEPQRFQIVKQKGWSRALQAHIPNCDNCHNLLGFLCFYSSLGCFACAVGQ